MEDVVIVDTSVNEVLNVVVDTLLRVSWCILCDVDLVGVDVVVLDVVMDEVVNSSEVY